MGDFIYLSEEGKLALEEAIKALDLKIQELKKNRYASGSRENAQIGNGVNVETTDSRILVLESQLKQLEGELRKVKIVAKSNNKDTIDLEDIITVIIEYSENDTEELTFRLVGGEANLDGEIEEATINSPLGMAVYGKTVGNQTSFQVDQNKILVFIKDVEKQNNKGISR